MRRAPVRDGRAAVVWAALLLCSWLLPGSALAKSRPPLQALKAYELRETLRDLWIDHVFWEREALRDAKAGDAAAVKVAEERVKLSARAVGDLLGSYFGKDAGDRISASLAAHYGAVNAYATAAFARDGAAREATSKKLTAEAYDFASYLSGLNGNWPMVGLVSLLSAHATHHAADVDALAAGNPAAEADAWDALQKGVYELSDELSEGIVKLFPRKFPKTP